MLKLCARYRFARRNFGSSVKLSHKKLEKPTESERLRVSFKTTDGDTTHLFVKPGSNLLDIAHNNDIELEGACEGSLACSTCHVIVKEEYYAKMDEPGDEENDMLDLAFGLTNTSRLGCQVVMTRELDGLEVEIPRATRNLQLKDS